MDRLVNSSNITGSVTRNIISSSFSSLNLRSILLVFGITIVALNLLALSALIRSRKMNMQIRYHAMNLTITDILIGINQLLMYTTLSLSATNNMVLCTITLYSYRIVCNQNTLVITSLAVDRFLCLYFDVMYVQYVTKRFILISSALVWLLNIFYSIISYIATDAHEHDFCFVVNRFRGIEYTCALIITCFIVVFISYFGIFINIRKHLNKIKSNRVDMSGVMKMQFKYTVKVTIIALAFFITYLPLSIHIFLVTLRPNLLWKTLLFYYISGFIYLTNSIINPILYALRFQECRLEIVSLLCFWNKKMSKRNDQRKKELHAVFLEIRPFQASSVTPISKTIQKCPGTEPQPSTEESNDSQVDQQGRC